MASIDRKIKLKITDLKRHDLGYYWQISINNDSTLLEHGAYHTNHEGRGLWKEDHQILGTFEFELPSNHIVAINKIKRYFKEKWQNGLSKRLSNKTKL
jgi:hypothetical protein